MSGPDQAERLLVELLQAGVIPALEADRLRIDAPRGCLTTDRRERITGCLPELRMLVGMRWRSREECVVHRPCRRMSPCAEPQEGRPCLMPATCCLCGAGLPSGRRYLCRACSDASLTTISETKSQGAQS